MDKLGEFRREQYFHLLNLAKRVEDLTVATKMIIAEIHLMRDEMDNKCLPFQQEEANC